MGILEWLKDLYRHMEWADARMWGAVFALPTEAQGDERLRYLCHHIPVVQDAFLKLWTDAPMVHPELGEFEDLAALRAWNRAYYPKLHAFLETVDEAALARGRDLPWAAEIAHRVGKAPEPTTLAEMMTQVPAHSLHHRGQLAARLRELGGEPPLIDFIAWVWFDRPGAEWPG